MFHTLSKKGTNIPVAASVHNNKAEMFSPLSHRTFHNTLPREIVPLHAGLGEDDVPKSYVERYRQIAKYCFLVESVLEYPDGQHFLTHHINHNLEKWIADAVACEARRYGERIDRRCKKLRRDCPAIVDHRVVPCNAEMFLDETRTQWDLDFEVERIQYGVVLKMLAYHEENPMNSFELISRCQFDVVIHFPNVVICIGSIPEEQWEVVFPGIVYPAMDIQEERRMVFNAHRNWVGFDGKKNIVVITWNPTRDVLVNGSRLFGNDDGQLDQRRIEAFRVGFCRMFSDLPLFHQRLGLVRVAGVFRSSSAGDVWYNSAFAQMPNEAWWWGDSGFKTNFTLKHYDVWSLARCGRLYTDHPCVSWPTYAHRKVNLMCLSKQMRRHVIRKRGRERIYSLRAAWFKAHPNAEPDRNKQHLRASANAARRITGLPIDRNSAP